MSNRIMNEGIDLERLIRQMLKKLWLILLFVILGAAAGCALYGISKKINEPKQIYIKYDRYYIDFDLMKDASLPDYFNAFTWNTVLRTDIIMDLVLEYNPSLEPRLVDAYITGEIKSDVRLLSLIFEGDSIELIKEMSEAYAYAMEKFGEKTNAIKSVTSWDNGDILPTTRFDRWLGAATLGGIIALVASIFGMLLYYIVDDRIYDERDWIKRYSDIPWLGKKGSKEYELNSAAILGDSNYFILATKDFDFSEELIYKMGKSIVLKITPGFDKTKEIDKIISTLSKQDILIKAVES